MDRLEDSNYGYSDCFVEINDKARIPLAITLTIMLLVCMDMLEDSNYSYSNHYVEIDDTAHTYSNGNNSNNNVACLHRHTRR